MIPYMSIIQRFIAWLLWRLNGWSDTDGCRFECIEHPELSHSASLMRDYWYVRRSRETDERGA